MVPDIFSKILYVNLLKSRPATYKQISLRKQRLLGNLEIGSSGEVVLILFASKWLWKAMK